MVNGELLMVNEEHSIIHRSPFSIYRSLFNSDVK